MVNPLANVPLNSKQVFVMAKTNTGCEVYMPVDSDSDRMQKRKRNELRAFLVATTPLGEGIA